MLNYAGMRGGDIGKKQWDYIKSRFSEIEAWLGNGLSEKQIIKNLAISKTTFEKYKKECPELSELLKKGRRKIVEEIENALFKRARGFEYEETETLIKEVGCKVPHRRTETA